VDDEWADWWRPSVAVDAALLTVAGGCLAVVVHQATGGPAAGQWLLPGTFLHEHELLADAVLRALRDKVGVGGHSPRQLRVFDALDRDDRGRVLSVAHVDLVRSDRVEGCTLAPLVGDRAQVPGRQRRMPYEHDDIVQAAVSWARRAYEDAVDPADLLDQPFTLADLRRLHAAVAGQPLPKDTFRRSVTAALHGTGQLARGSVGRPAELFCKKPGARRERG
jgi:8-oxo-dGTP diphosphatase